MKNYIPLLFLIIIIGNSCSEERTIEDGLIGDWIYERETFTAGSNYNDSDIIGVMTFNEDETGNWMRTSQINTNTSFEWDFQKMDTRISISKGLFFVSSASTSTRVYEVKQEGDDKFTFTYEIYLNQLDTLPLLQEFEHIVLKKI